MGKGDCLFPSRVEIEFVWWKKHTCLSVPTFLLESTKECRHPNTVFFWCLACLQELFRKHRPVCTTPTIPESETAARKPRLPRPPSRRTSLASDRAGCRKKNGGPVRDGGLRFLSIRVRHGCVPGGRRRVRPRDPAERACLGWRGRGAFCGGRRSLRPTPGCLRAGRRVSRRRRRGSRPGRAFRRRVRRGGGRPRSRRRT